jgi:hypothetical protein
MEQDQKQRVNVGQAGVCDSQTRLLRLTYIAQNTFPLVILSFGKELQSITAHVVAVRCFDMVTTSIMEKMKNCT